jgi:hypothetical protein
MQLSLFSALVAAGLALGSLAWAQSDLSPSSSDRSPSHVQQNQTAKPAPKNSPQREQSAQTPAVVPPPATGDRSVINPPANGAAKTPVIRPPGTPGDNEEVQPK